MVFVTGSNGFIGKNMLTGLSDLKDNAVIHMAAISNTSCYNWNDLRAINVDWSIQLAEDCYRQDIPFLYASSASVYGNGGEPLNLYARSKLMLDKLMENRRGRWYGLRFFNVWGPGEGHKGNQASLIHRLQNGLREVWLPEVKRDFVHVSDCVSVARWMIEERPPSGIYDVGTGHPVSVRELADKYGMNVNFIPIPDTVAPYYQLYTCADLSRLREAGYTKMFKLAA